MTDFTREEILEFVKNQSAHNDLIANAREFEGMVGLATEIRKTGKKYETIRQCVEQANPELFKGEK